MARLVYRMLKFGEAYIDIGVQTYEEKYRTRIVKNLTKRATDLGYHLVPKQQTDPTTMISPSV